MNENTTSPLRWRNNIGEALIKSIAIEVNGYPQQVRVPREITTSAAALEFVRNKYPKLNITCVCFDAPTHTCVHIDYPHFAPCAELQRLERERQIE